MGVTLERVQNKFACIIGELCSEPVILSQFAIWVDLRIAEYKAKGAISLECSGEDPDPIWLKGHKPAPPAVKRDTTPVRHHGRRMGDNSIQRPHSDSLSLPMHSHLDQSEEAAARLSPDIVVIKEEPQEDESVFPVSLHRHDDSAVTRNTTPRKRTSDPVASPDGRHSPSKHRKITSSSSSSPALHIEPINQSLMSIISEGALEESGDSSTNFTLDYSSLDPSNQDNSTPLFQSQPGPSTSSGDSVDQQDNSSTVPECPPTSASSPAFQQNTESTAVQPRGRAELPAPAKRNAPSRSVKARIANIESKSSTTVGNLVGAVSKLENWLAANHQDFRNIEEIPPVELDQYLVMFFSILKNRHGCDYDPESFSNFRSFLERFLKERGYPASLSSSSVFSQSQAIYNDKRRALAKAAVERRRARHRHYFLNLQLAAALAQRNAAQESNDEPQNLSKSS